MKSVLLSIKPEYCEFIASGRKTLEVRKNRPKIPVPFKCYIYCTKQYYRKGDGYFQGKYCGKVIGEFICDRIDKFTAEFTDGECYEDIRYCYRDERDEEQEMIVVSNEWSNPNSCWLCKESCLSFDDFRKYIGANFHYIPFYAWHITDLVIYDKPKDLDEFEKPCSHDCKNCKYWHLGSPTDYEPLGCIWEWEDFVIKHPPQSWRYVEEE